MHARIDIGAEVSAVRALGVSRDFLRGCESICESASCYRSCLRLLRLGRPNSNGVIATCVRSVCGQLRPWALLHDPSATADVA
jgi:hypothetical protein